MKLAFFDDFKLGLVKGDTIHDVSAAVTDIPHIGPGSLMNGLITRFADYRGKLEDAAAGPGIDAVGRVRARANGSAARRYSARSHRSAMRPAA